MVVCVCNHRAMKPRPAHNNPENPSGVAPGAAGILGTIGRMRGMTDRLSIGRRIAWYRRRRGMSQEVLADLIERTADWVGKVENDRINLDRLSVIATIAEVLDVTIGDLVSEPSLMDWTPDSGNRTVPALRDVLLDYRQITPLLGARSAEAPPSSDALRAQLGDVMGAYQTSRYGLMTRLLPILLRGAHAATDATDSEDEQRAARSVLALSYQAAAAILTKLGEGDLAWIAADRGLVAARTTGDPVVVGSLFRSVSHTLLATGRYRAAVELTTEAAGYLDQQPGAASPTYLSVYGMLFLTGSMAASRTDDRATTTAFLNEADQTATRLGPGANHLWTAFGPTNVAIHRIATAVELGDSQVALDLSGTIDTAAMPVERRVRHAIDVAHAYTARRRTDEAVSVMLDAERVAPEQVRYHAMSRQLVLRWLRQCRTRPSRHLSDLARRMHLVAG
jgi:transcriptional regulator with XRE-family HTH domain